MLASLADAPLDDPALVYEPKYDGIRAIAEVPAGGAGVRLWSRLGNDKTNQFPEVATALSTWARRRKEPLVLDGEVVALDAAGEPTGFQQLQGRIHLINGEPTSGRIAFIVFDLLREGSRDLRERPLHERRSALERILGHPATTVLRISEQVRGGGRAMYDRALASGWEGLIAKHVDSKYASGKRSPEWRKLKIVQEQEFVIGGWTEPRQSRACFGALLLGVYEADDFNRRERQAKTDQTQTGSAASALSRLTYVGHTGTGFDRHELERVMSRLKQLESPDSPFASRPRANERPHWVKPELVAQIKFTEWTSDNKLRHPVYLGLRDDKRPGDVQRERKARLTADTTVRLTTPFAKPDAAAKVQPPNDGVAGRAVKSTTVAAGKPLKVGARKAAETSAPASKRAAKPRRGGKGANASRAEAKPIVDSATVTSLVQQLEAIESSRGDGTLELPDGGRFAVTNLHKLFWPRQKFTKGDLFRYYVRMSPYLLPAIGDRPLVMKRFPNGVAAKPFYQHRAADPPAGVRVEQVAVAEQRSQLIGGDLKTLLYTTQLAAISQDPWFSRVQSPESADYVALDLDPSEGVTFKMVLDVARWIRDELKSLGAESVPKTSGADGLHIYVPLPPGTPYEVGLLFCQIIATVVAHKHPKVATVERSVRARGRTVYVDYLQNIQGKTLASAYSARASDYAGVSAPLTWAEVDAGVRREDFTIATMPDRVAAVGDLWAALRDSPGVDLTAVSKYHTGDQ